MYNAIIVEPRKHKALTFVIKNFLENLSEEWTFIIFHGDQNLDYINNILKNDMVEKERLRITLINLHIDNLTLRQYNNMFRDESFYSHIPREIFLVFQTDTMIFKKHRDIIYEFLDYDYVGAPWKTDESWAKELNYVGNGGLSLRKKSKMLEIIRKHKNTNINDNEDVFFSRTYKNISVKKPSYELAKRFSIETILSDITFGCHSPWKYIDNNILYSMYPEIKILKELQDVKID